MKKLLLLILLLASGGFLFAQGLPIKSGASSNLATVNANKAILINQGNADRPTYNVNASGLTTTAAYNVNIEAPAGTGFKLVSICVGWSGATASAAATITVQRRTSASSSGTLCTNEGTAASCNVSKFDPADGNYGGVARVTATQGGAGAIIDQYSVMQGTLTAPETPICKTYGTNGEKMPIVQAGVANGLSISVGALGAGSLASGSFSAIIIAE